MKPAYVFAPVADPAFTNELGKRGIMVAGGEWNVSRPIAVELFWTLIAIGVLLSLVNFLPIIAMRLRVRIGTFLLRLCMVGVLLFVLGRPVVRTRLWAATPALVLLLGLDDAPVRWEPHPAWLSTAFAVAAVWCVARADRNRRWLIGAGVAAAAAYAFKQNTGAFILAAVLLWCGRRQFLAPFLAFAVVTLAWLAPLVVALDGQLGPPGSAVGDSRPRHYSGAPRRLRPRGCRSVNARLGSVST